MSHYDDETLALLALGEAGVTPDADAHLAECPTCRAEVASLAGVVGVGDRHGVGRGVDGGAAGARGRGGSLAGPGGAPGEGDEGQRRGGGEQVTAGRHSGDLRGSGRTKVRQPLVR